MKSIVNDAIHGRLASRSQEKKKKKKDMPPTQAHARADTATGMLTVLMIAQQKLVLGNGVRVNADRPRGTSALVLVPGGRSTGSHGRKEVDTSQNRSRKYPLGGVVEIESMVIVAGSARL